MTHQELLDRYVQSELSVIGQFSGNFVQDWWDLVTQVEKHAAEHGLSTACLDETRQMIADSTYGVDD